MTRRPTTTAKMKLEVLSQHDVWLFCPECGCEAHVSEVEYDHKIALALGGEHSAENLQPLCSDCHKFKTHGPKHAFHKSDRGQINKVKRLEKARLAHEAGEKKAKKHRPIQSRGFDKSLRKKMNGEIVKRD